MESTTIDRPPREFVRGSRANMRVSLRRSPPEPEPQIELDEFIERLRIEAFDAYATIRAAQRESARPTSERAVMLAAAAIQARSIADAINLYCAAPILGLDAAEAFGVPI
jgi:hypothetical protein